MASFSLFVMEILHGDDVGLLTYMRRPPDLI